MKKILYVLIILIFSSFMAACNDNPYVGKYKSADNTILELNKNNNCTIINTLYKEAFYTNGKYTLKDNNINITFDKKQTNYFGVSSLSGKFEGNRIKLNNTKGNKYYIYSKQ